MRRAALALAVLVGAACAPTPPPADTAAMGGTAMMQSGDGEVTGEVAVVGSAPMNVQVVVQTGRASVRVEGPLRDEIRALSGARVSVQGRMGRDQITATRYRVISVDGRPVLFGTVERAGDGLALRLDDGSVVALQGATTAFRPGQKVWVQGPTSVRVQVFGIAKP